MLQLRVYGDRPTTAALAERLEGLAGARHVSVQGGPDGPSLVTADLRAAAADHALTALGDLGIQSEDIALVRLDTIGSDADGSSALVWADVLALARRRARRPGRYFALMASGGVIGALAVVNDNTTLIVGAMAISPDLLPVTAACTGIVLLRPGLVRRGLATLAAGFATAGLLAALVSVLFDRFDLLPRGFSLQEFSAVQTHVNATTILVALSAGVAGMLAVETRASAAVGVAISVTTIPAVAYLGVALGLGELDTSLSGLAVLTANVACMLLGGSLVLAAQRARSGF